MYYGCEKEINDKRDYKATVHSSKSNIFPEKYEIDIPEVKDQGIVNSCVAHTLASFLEETYKLENIKFSTGFIYGYRPLGYSQEEGMYPRQAIKTLLKVGDVVNESFNHNIEMPEIKDLVDKNIDTLKQEANKYKIQSYARIYTQDEIKKLLYNDITVPVSIPVYNDLKLNEQNIIINNDCSKFNGYHMMLIIGWNKSGYIVQNSWGKDWGNEGKAILPYDYPIDTAWAISTEGNAVSTYTTIWQKVYIIFSKMIHRFKNLFS